MPQDAQSPAIRGGLQHVGACGIVLYCYFMRKTCFLISSWVSFFHYSATSLNNIVIALSVLLRLHVLGETSRPPQPFLKSGCADWTGTSVGGTGETSILTWHFFEPSGLPMDGDEGCDFIGFGSVRGFLDTRVSLKKSIKENMSNYLHIPTPCSFDA